MKKVFLILFLLAVSYALHAQSTPTVIYRVANSTTTFIKPLSAGNLICDIESKKTYRILTSIAGTNSLKTLTEGTDYVEFVKRDDLSFFKDEGGWINPYFPLGIMSLIFPADGYYTPLNVDVTYRSTYGDTVGYQFSVDGDPMIRVYKVPDGAGGTITKRVEIDSLYIDGVKYSAGSEETDPIFSAWDKSTGISITESQISDFGSYLTSESDPVFGAHATFGITSTNITNWNTAYGWGDHSSAGYLTSYTETDPVFGAWDKSTGISITESQISDLDDYAIIGSATAGKIAVWFDSDGTLTTTNSFDSNGATSIGQALNTDHRFQVFGTTSTHTTSYFKSAYTAGDAKAIVAMSLQNSSYDKYGLYAYTQGTADDNYAVYAFANGGTRDWGVYSASGKNHFQYETEFASDVTMSDLGTTSGGNYITEVSDVLQSRTSTQVREDLDIPKHDTRSETITIVNPTSSEDRTIFYTTQNMQVTAIHAIVVGSDTPSVSIKLGWTFTRNGALSYMVSTWPINEVDYAENPASISNSNIDADCFIVLETTAQSGTVTELMVTIEYILD